MTIIESLAWISMALAMLAFTIKNEFYLRLFTALGCGLSVIYYGSLGLVPATLLNSYIALICSYYLISDMVKKRRGSSQDD
jgi:hypothetical protein